MRYINKLYVHSSTSFEHNEAFSSIVNLSSKYSFASRDQSANFNSVKNSINFI